MIDTFTIAGSPEHCREQMRKVIDAGIRHPIAFEIPGVAPDEAIESVHRHVTPHFV